MKSNRRFRRVKVSADGAGLVSRAGALLLRELTVDTGLAAGWTEALLDTDKAFPTVHLPGRVLADLAVMIADGGDALTHLATLRDQSKLFGTVASEPTAWRAVDRVDEVHLAALRQVRTAARERAWQAGAGPDLAAGLTIDLDATITIAHARVTRRPSRCWCGPTPPAPRTASPRPCASGAVSSRSGSASTRRSRTRCWPCPSRHRPRRATSTANPATGAWIAEITDCVNLTSWPEGSRLIVRRERPHPGAQLRFSDVDGHRFTAFLTDTPAGQLPDLEVRHRSHARVEGRIRCGKATGLRSLPCKGYQQNKVWLELSLTAADLLTWAQALCFDDALARCEPAAFRYRVCHVAARLVRTGRSWRLRIDKGWPWAAQLANAFERLRAAPWPT